MKFRIFISLLLASLVWNKSLFICLFPPNTANSFTSICNYYDHDLKKSHLSQLLPPTLVLKNPCHHEYSSLALTHVDIYLSNYIRYGIFCIRSWKPLSCSFWPQSNTKNLSTIIFFMINCCILSSTFKCALYSPDYIVFYFH